ncbi:hypothetical protein BGZ93_002136 [Podila epicladia]|nr:hypothetical protein BGZ93_002136 [Podila epicladia]
MDVDPVPRPLPLPSTAQSDVVMAPSHPTERSLPNPSTTPAESFDTTNTHAFENLLVGLSNPRGTSISSSLLPIRPDSDDEDVYNREDQDFSRSGRQPSRGRPGPDLVADLIQHQFAQHETTPYHPATTPREPMQTVEPQQELNNSTASVERREPTEIPSAAQHRRRLRSSSLRGVMGFQPTGTVNDETMSTTTPDNSERTEATRPSVDRPPFMPNQLHFLTRLLADISRGLPEGEGRDSPTGSDVASNSANPQDEATPPRRRHPTTIRLIQVGGLGFGRPRETGGSVETTTAGETAGETTGETIETSSTMTDTTATTGDATNGSTTGLNPSGGGSTAPGSGTEDAAGEGARLEEAVGEAFIVFLSSPTTEPESETENTREGRPRAPWVVVSFSGAYLSSLMAGAVNEGVSYEDLWMLSNLIGPARPITTTQEAINSAGFHVGQFEHEVQGMRGCSTLGDGSRCLVCMSEYEEGEDMRALKCRHGFHQECIDKWLTTGANKCPICRAAAVVSSESEAPVPEVGVEE